MLVASAYGVELHGIYWHETDGCTQTGTLGEQERVCQAPEAPNFLEGHTVPMSERLKQPLGLYCAYEALGDKGAPLRREGKDFTGEPAAGDEMGDEHENMCASWDASGEPISWGLQLASQPEIAHFCEATHPDRRCAIEHFTKLNGTSDRPWASYFQNPVLAVTGFGGPVVLVPEERWKFPENGPEHEGSGWGWGYLCPILQNVDSGARIELCFEQWRGFDTGQEWEYRHVAECGEREGHPYDKLIAYSPRGFTSEFEEIEEDHEPATKIDGAGATGEVGARDWEAYVAEDDHLFSPKAPEAGEHGEREHEPAFGYGCGRSDSATAEDWTLVGISDGIETWDTHYSQYQLYEPSARTIFEAKPIGIGTSTASPTSEDAAISTSLTPYGFPTRYVIEYGRERIEHTTTPVAIGTGLSPLEVRQTLTGLKPGTTYHYRINAYHYEGAGEHEVLTDVTYGPEQSFTTSVEDCAGVNISGQGGGEIAAAQSVWRAGFNSSKNSAACSGTQGSKGTPTVGYEVTSSGTALESWQSTRSVYGPANAFLGTAEPPNEAGIAEIESKEQTVTPHAVESVPVAQLAVAVVVNLPSACTATNSLGEGRLVLSQATLQSIFAGSTRTWAEITDDGDTLSGTGCNASTPIARVVPSTGSGVTHILKRYLGELHPEALLTESETMKTWAELSEGALSTIWPKGTSVIKSAAPLSKVTETPGSIGFAALTEARSSGQFSGSGGGPGTPRFWVEIQNKNKSFKDPSSNGDSETVAEANCKKTTYANGSNSFPPPTVFAPWSEVSAKPTSDTYPLCGLVYMIALYHYTAFGSTTREAQTVKDYIEFAIASTGGRRELAKHDYSELPAGLLPEDAEGTSELGF